MSAVFFEDPFNKIFFFTLKTYFGTKVDIIIVRDLINLLKL